MGITAQFSLYPLRQKSLSPAIEAALGVLHERALQLEPGSMSTLITGDDAAIFAALHEAFRVAAAQSEVVMVVTFSNACPAAQSGAECTSGEAGAIDPLSSPTPMDRESQEGLET
jgi:uncharacterized protein YqgV (UPF0045/DUF77 family)